MKRSTTENNVLLIKKYVLKLLDLVEMLLILPNIVQIKKKEKEKKIYLRLE